MSVTTANTGTSLWGTGSYTYDAMGNLTWRSLGTPLVDTGQPLSMPGRPFRASTTVTGQVDRLAFTFAGTTPKISVVTANGLDHTVAYDAAGNETSYLANRSYSARNLMNAVVDNSGEGPTHLITYGYDWRGVRVSRTETPTDAGSASRYFFYSPELQLLESTVDDSNNVWGQSAHHISANPLAANRDIIWFNGAPVAEIGPQRTPDNTPLSSHRTFATAMEATNTFWTFTDHLGTPLIQMDNTTTIVWRAEHEPYGNVWKMRAGARTDQPLRFPGQELAMTWEGAEENYNVFRWYGSSFARYSQADPIGLGGAVAVYTYANDSPATFLDRTGLTPTPPLNYPVNKGCQAGPWHLEPASVKDFDLGTYSLYSLFGKIPPDSGLAATQPGALSQFTKGFTPFIPKGNGTASVSGGSCTCLYQLVGAMHYFDTAATYKRSVQCGCGSGSVQTFSTWNKNQKQLIPTIAPSVGSKGWIYTDAPYNAGTNECLCAGTLQF